MIAADFSYKFAMINFIVSMTSMFRYVLTIIALVFSALLTEGLARDVVVVDSVNRSPLPGASIFDRQGNSIGISNSKGRTPYIADESYPITVRYLGFKERIVTATNDDTVALQEIVSELPEVVIESRSHKVMHILAYVREYSTLTTYTDTVFLFREKMVDYMLTPDKKSKLKGWSSPRILACKSYYRFSNADGLDSVSDASNHHFSWSDWIGVVPVAEMPPALRGVEYATDTLRGKYSPTEIWIRNSDRVTVNVNVLADTTSRKWVPNLSGFFRRNLDFENFRVRFNYGDVVGDTISPMDLAGYSFNIESRGRGHEMFRFNRVDEPCFVSTYAEVYILDKEYITVKEAKKWDKHNFMTDEIGIYRPLEAPELQPSILDLMARVDNIDKEGVRLGQEPDSRMISQHLNNQNFKLGNRLLFMLKQLTGISLIKSNKNMNRQWGDFKKGKKRSSNRLSKF